MIKDIVVNLSVTKEGSPASDYAISIASAFEAHLAGVAFLYDPIVPISGTGYIPPEVIDTQQTENTAAAKAALDRFNEATSRAGITAEPLRFSASLAGAGDQFGRIARRFDLAIVGQAEPHGPSLDDIIAETTLFTSGRPMIVVPYIQKEPLKLDRVMVCWDGSRQSARAVGDALPFLIKAGSVEIVVVTNERGKQDEIEGADIAEHLARHDIKVSVHRVAKGDIDVADALLSHASDSGTDMMVMGGYGHSRLREFVLGGVTHTILRSMTVPVLMAH
ncbi:MAG TPA: universal stress protein [Xanthobacteraceae bacterium]|jgi:nucleotide-binding universal stress UspA family protein|nr:universal stress protein [Xanthobacteraceae bacterium]